MKTKNPSIAALTLLSFLAASASAQVSAPGAVAGPGASATGAVGAPTSTASSTTNATSSTTNPVRAPDVSNPNPPITPNPVAPINPSPIPRAVDNSTADQVATPSPGYPQSSLPTQAAQNNATAPQRASGQPLSPDAVPAANPNLAPIDARLNPANPNLPAVNPNLNQVNPSSPSATAPSDIGVSPNGRAAGEMNGTANSAVNAGAARNGVVGTSSSTADAVNSSLAGSAAVQGDIPSSDVNRRSMEARANAGADIQSQTPINGLATGNNLSTSATSVLSPGETVRDIRSANQSSRDALYSQVNGRLENAGRLVSDLDHRANELRGDAKTQFKAAAADIRDKERALKRSLNDVRKASNDNWSDAQARLAADYEAYATAIARAQAAAGVGDLDANPNLAR